MLDPQQILKIKQIRDFVRIYQLINTRARLKLKQQQTKIKDGPRTWSRKTLDSSPADKR